MTLPRRLPPIRVAVLRAALIAVVALLMGLSVSPALAAPPEDLGDAPAAYDQGGAGPATAVIAGPRLGTKVTADNVDPETGVSVHASASAEGDEGDDGAGPFAPLQVRRLGRTETSVAVSGVTDSARLCGWIDYDQSDSWDPGERSCVSLSAGDTTATLRWFGRPTAVGPSYVRLRIASAAAEAESPDGSSATGEIEDYPISFVTDPTPEPSLRLQKTVSPTRVSTVGQVVHYRFVAENTGAVAVDHVRVSDDLPGLGSMTCDPDEPASLEPGQSLTCTATRPTTQADLDFGTVFNVAEVRGEGPGGDADDPTDDVTAVGDAAVDGVQQPGLSVTASVSPAKARPGQRVTFVLHARNTGNVTLTGTQVSAVLPRLGRLSCRPKQGSALAPKAVLTCRGTYRVASSGHRSVTLKATARADKPYGDAADRSDDVVARDSVTLRVVAATSTGHGSSGSGSTDGSGGAHLADTGGVDGRIVVAGVLVSVLGLGLLLLGVWRTRVARRR